MLPLLCLFAVLSLVSSTNPSIDQSTPQPIDQSINQSLLGVILVSRHGTRAPNLSTVKVCPANIDNLHRYVTLDISLEGVTGRGMSQLLNLGEWCRSRYIQSGFLSEFYRNDELYIRAVGEDRTLQSAVAFAEGLYPAGKGPRGWREGVPPPVPVYTLPDELDTLLENRKAGCQKQLAQDIEDYDQSIGVKERQEHKELIDQLGKVCGVNLTALPNFGDAVKDITDNFSFDLVEGFPLLPGIDQSTLLAFRSYAVRQLLGRILGKDDQITYLNGDLPENMIDTFSKLINQREKPSESESKFEKKPLKFIAYHGHREMLYALAAYLDIDFNVTYPALPVGAIPAATTLLFELHTVGASTTSSTDQSIDQNYEVRAVMWTPCDQGEADHQIGDILPIINAEIDENAMNQSIARRPTRGNSGKSHHSSTHSSWRSPSHIQCGARPVAMNHRKCHDGVCSFAAFKSIVKARLRSTGHWKEICEADRLEQENDELVIRSAKKHKQEEQEEEEYVNERHDHEDEGVRIDQSTNSTATADVKTSKSSAMMIVLYVLLGAIGLGALLYWCFVRRTSHHDRGEYQRV